MKTHLAFFDADTGERSECGDPLEIEVSSASLPWEGVLLEKGWAPHFHPRNVVTRTFYFALAIESRFAWKVETPSKARDLTTEVGQIWINPPDSPFTHVVDEPCHFIILAIDKDTLLRSFEPGPLPEDLQFLGDYNIEDPTIQALMEMLLREASNRNRNGIHFVSSLLRAFAIHFVRNYSNLQELSAQRKSGSTLDASKLAELDTYIQRNLEEDVGVDDLARVCGMSRFHFLKEFKKATGTTPYQHLLRRRLERAKDLLRTERIVVVAHHLGFSDQSHFGNAFKRQFGHPPGEAKSS